MNSQSAAPWPVDPIRQIALQVAVHSGGSGETIVRAAGVYEDYLRNGSPKAEFVIDPAVASEFNSPAPEYVPVAGWPERPVTRTPFACVEHTFEPNARVFYFGSVEQALEERGCLAAHYPGTEWRVFIQL